MAGLDKLGIRCDKVKGFVKPLVFIKSKRKSDIDWLLIISIILNFAGLMIVFSINYALGIGLFLILWGENLDIHRKFKKILNLTKKL